MDKLTEYYNDVVREYMRTDARVIKIPPGWVLHGTIPDTSPIYDDEMEKFDEDICYIVNQNDGYVVDLGWYPSWDPTGQFHARLIKDDNWDTPVAWIKTKKLTHVKNWIEEQFQKVSTQDNYDYLHGNDGC